MRAIESAASTAAIRTAYRSIPRLTRFSLWLGLVLMPLAAWGQKPACTTTGTISTTPGPLCGLAPSPGGPAVSSYLGIPYAQAQRWQAPQPVQPFAGTFNATQKGDRCLKLELMAPLVCPPPGYSEDCLSLNVWVPQGASPASPLPVMVFIHGGAFLTGSGESALDDGAKLAAAGNVIVVTLNYRLGALGFLVQDVSNPAGMNLGFRDQIAALQWVQANIGAFGGAADNVTIFGESAGAMSVGLHALSSPQSSGLFKAALMESNPLGLAYMTPSQAAGVTAALVQDLDCAEFSSTSACLQNISACSIAQAETKVTKSLLMGGMTALPFAPVIDGELLVQQPMAAADSGKLQVPMLLGTNQNEGTLFAELAELLDGEFNLQDYQTFLTNLLGADKVDRVQQQPGYSCTKSPTDCTTPMAEVITDYVFACANRHLAGNAAATTWAYRFSQISGACNLWKGLAPACSQQVCHGAELPYVFDTPGAALCVFLHQGNELSTAMQQYWTSFARSKSPSGPVAWPPLQSARNYMILSWTGNQGPQMAVDPLNGPNNCAFWESIGYGQPAVWDRFLASLPGHRAGASTASRGSNP